MNVEALAGDIKRSIFNPPPDPHRDVPRLIIARSDLLAKWSEYEALCSEFVRVVQNIQHAPDAVLRDLLLTHADYRLDRIAKPVAKTLPEVQNAIAVISHEIATLTRRVAELKSAESSWARTPLDQRNRELLLAVIYFFAQGPAPEHVSAIAHAAGRALSAGYLPPRDEEWERTREIQQAHTDRALAPPMAQGFVRHRGQPAAISHGTPEAWGAKPLPVMPNAAVVGSSADAFMRGEGLNDVLTTRPTR
jgi:hypothetical protein